MIISLLKGDDNLAKKETVRLNINIPVDLMNKVDIYADNMAINRTSAVAVLLSMALDNQRAMNTLEELMIAYKEEVAKKDNSAISTN